MRTIGPVREGDDVGCSMQSTSEICEGRKGNAFEVHVFQATVTGEGNEEESTGGETFRDDSTHWKSG